MTINLPEAIESRCTPRATALGLAIGMFVTEEVTLGQAAEIAGFSQADFLKELGRRRVAIHYGHEELAEDLKTVAALSTR